jgi:small subunit ribosomal protein S17
MTEAKKSLKRTLIGKVVSDKRAKTVTVLIERRVKHELYGKIVGKSSKYHAHDEKGEYKMGDMIEITESRPISKTKNWVATRWFKKPSKSEGLALQADRLSLSGSQLWAVFNCALHIQE